MTGHDPQPPIQIYDPKAVQTFGYLRVSRVEVVENQGDGDLVEVRAGTDSDVLWKSIRWHCRQDDAPKAGEVFQFLLVKPSYAVMGVDDLRVLPPDDSPPQQEPTE